MLKLRRRACRPVGVLRCCHTACPSCTACSSCAAAACYVRLWLGSGISPTETLGSLRRECSKHPDSSLDLADILARRGTAGSLVLRCRMNAAL